MVKIILGCFVFGNNQYFSNLYDDVSFLQIILLLLFFTLKLYIILNYPIQASYSNIRNLDQIFNTISVDVFIK